MLFKKLRKKVYNSIHKRISKNTTDEQTNTPNVQVNQVGSSQKFYDPSKVVPLRPDVENSKVTGIGAEEIQDIGFPEPGHMAGVSQITIPEPAFELANTDSLLWASPKDVLQHKKRELSVHSDLTISNEPVLRNAVIRPIYSVNNNRVSWYSIFCVFTACLLPLTIGYYDAIQFASFNINGKPFLDSKVQEKPNNVAPFSKGNNATDAKWVVAIFILPILGMIGSMLTIVMGEVMGRRRVLTIATLIALVGGILMSASNHYVMWIVGREEEDIEHLTAKERVILYFKEMKTRESVERPPVTLYEPEKGGTVRYQHNIIVP
ncbi:hypothetical protein AX774_g6013 [Zancudomyces culisetae]|uniref:Major facilitator superfamily (MFS) profile domain-containing protein n=1 Tax=Zancudomyces culisetae TaxID=1213189 RepID=A0A1R1PI17_ZANCU|nr:hypothetical protein AX774_g6013 [Zancudomyces culisetae]|eukprot:OMH80553.1 hypothetical protein AX774_g6013 [Zancudomyces culisetae]